MAYKVVNGVQHSEVLGIAYLHLSLIAEARVFCDIFYGTNYIVERKKWQAFGNILLFFRYTPSCFGEIQAVTWMFVETGRAVCSWKLVKLLSQLCSCSNKGYHKKALASPTFPGPSQLQQCSNLTSVADIMAETSQKPESAFGADRMGTSYYGFTEGKLGP